MRRTLAVLAMLVLATGRGNAASSTPAISPEEAHAGCYHADLRPCVISLGMAFAFDMKPVAEQIAKRNELDVNGQTAHRMILIDARPPGRTETIGIVLTLASPAPNDRVVKVTLTLPAEPDLAHTASEYDGTRLYDAVSVVLGKSCPNLDKMTLYRFYENSIKPRETLKTDIKQYGIFHYTKQTVDTEKLPFCGAMFSVHRRIEFEGTPDMPNRKPSAVSYIDIE